MSVRVCVCVCVCVCEYLNNTFSLLVYLSKSSSNALVVFVLLLPGLSRVREDVCSRG